MLNIESQIKDFALKKIYFLKQLTNMLLTFMSKQVADRFTISIFLALTLNKAIGKLNNLND